MDRFQLQTVAVQNYGCVKNASFSPARLHALIGPNDSGKTTLLRAIGTAMALARGASIFDGAKANTPFDPGISLSPTASESGLSLSLTASSKDGTQHATYQFGGYEESQHRESISGSGLALSTWRRGADQQSTWLADGRLEHLRSHAAFSFLRGACRWLHLDPAKAREGKLFSGQDAIFMDTDGGRLPAVYDAILSRGDDAYSKISDAVRSLFPSVKRVGLRPVSADSKTFELELTSGAVVRSSQISDGILYYLAFAALEYLEPPSVLLIEEPENGLHPARISEVMKVLRKVSERTQIILATHSPFVINELSGEEVSVVTRDSKQETQVRLLRDTPNFEERKKLYSLGELWVSYSNGVDEAPLFESVP